MNRPQWHSAFPLGLALTMALGCSSTPDPSTSTGTPLLTGTDEHIFLNDSIEKNYDPHVIMKRAESFFERENFPEAIVEYQHFLDMHRAHVLAPYAQFKLGESHFNMAESVDRDPEPVNKALAAFKKLLDAYPGSKFEIDALVKIRQCENWLAQVDLFVGQFYLRQEAYLAAAHRFEGILETDRELEAIPDALYYLAVAYQELGADDWARDKLILLADRYPGNGHQEKAERMLAALGGAPPPVAVAQQVVPESLTLQPAAYQNGENGHNGQNGHRPGTVPVIEAAHMNGDHAPIPRPRIERAAVTSPRAPSAAPAPAEPAVCRLNTWC